MATKYADFDLATGNNDGSDWTNAWKTMADAVAGSNSAPPAGGDTVYCRGTDTLSGTVTNNLVGGTTTGYIKFIGVNASGSNDGTRATLDCNGGNFSAVLQESAAFVLYENFRFTGSGNAHGVYITGGSNCVWINCSMDTNGGYGLVVTGQGFSNHLIRCVAYGNVYGFSSGNDTTYTFCNAHDNSNCGFLSHNGYYVRFYGCIAYDNTFGGVYSFYQGIAYHCVFDSNGEYGVLHYGAQNQNYTNLYIGCRFTNHSGAGDYGIDMVSQLSIWGWCYFDGNKDHYKNTLLTHEVLDSGVSTNAEHNEDGAGGGDTNQGYVSLTEGSEDYSTNYVSGTDPHIRRTAITIPVS